MKNKQAIYLLFAANSISGFAQGISMIAIPWYFSNVLGLPETLGIIYLLTSCVSMFWGLYAGSLIDRFNRRNIFIANSIVGCAMLALVSFYGFSTGQVPAALVAIIFAGTFFIYNVHYPNLYAFAQEISDRKDYGRITSYIEIQGQLTSALSGALAAILLKGTEGGYINLLGFRMSMGFDIPAWELHEIFLLDAITYVLAIALILAIRYTPIAQRTVENNSVWERVKTGFSFLRKHWVLFIFGNASFATFIALLVTNYYLKPTYIKNHLHLDADVYAAYEMYFALGSLLAGIAIRWLFRWTNTIMSIILMSLTAAGIFYLYVFNTNLAIFYAAAALLGLCNAGIRVMRITYLFNHIPNQFIGRTASVFITFNVAFRIVFIFLFSRAFFFQDDNMVYAFAGFGTFIFLFTLILARYYHSLVNYRSVES